MTKADALAAEGIKADSFLLLNVPDEMLIQRVVGRRLDPDTGDIYHLDFSPPPAEIVDRLVLKQNRPRFRANNIRPTRPDVLCCCCRRRCCCCTRFGC